MAAPILFLGLAVAGGLALLSRKGSSSSSASTQTTDQALIDPSEKMHPNAVLAQRAIVASMHVNSLSLYENTAVAIETQLKMPKTAANVRIWAQMAKQGGQAIAGEDDEIGGVDSYGDDAVSGADGYGDDEVGARRRVVKRLFAKHKAKPKPKPKPKRRPAPKRLAAPSSSSSSAPDVDWDSAQDDDEPQTSEAPDDEESDDDEVGAAKRKKLPDWLRFSATQSKLAGDPALIIATAQVMRSMGYAKHAAIHLKTALPPR